MKALRYLSSIVYPPTKAKLHRIVTAVGVLFAAASIGITWWGALGLSTEGKLGVTVGMLTTLAAGWKRAEPRIDKAIESLPIPADDKGLAEVLMMFALSWIAFGVALAVRHMHHLAQIGR